MGDAAASELKRKIEFGQPVLPLAQVFTFIFLTLAVYSFVRLEFVVWNWPQYDEISLSQIFSAAIFGLRFDISALLWINSILLLFAWSPCPSKYGQIKSRFLIYFGLVLNTPFIIMNMFDVDYINFSGRRMTIYGLEIWHELLGKVGGFWQTHWLLFLTNAIVVLIYMFAALRIQKWPANNKLPARSYSAMLLSSFFWFLVVAATIVIGTRGGLQNKPLSMASANIYPKQALNNTVLNSSFSLFMSLKTESLAKLNYFDSRELLQPYLNGYGQQFTAKPLVTLPNGMNVFLIVLESFSLEYMGSSNSWQGYTPFLDSLAKKSLFFTNAFANGKRSIDMMPSLLIGLPALMEDSLITSPHLSQDLLGLGHVFKNAGYQTYFFHGGRNGTMFFDSFTPRVGIDNFVGAQEFNDKRFDDGVWGIYDDAFMGFAADKLNEKDVPFFATLFSLSSHHPYSIPKKNKDMFPKGTLDIHESIGYTDYSLKKFFEIAETKSWYQNTLFIITADHTQLLESKKYNNAVGNFRVPLIFYHPKVDLKKLAQTDKVVQHADLYASLIDLLGLEMKWMPLLSRSIFQKGDRYAVFYYGGKYILVTSSKCLVFQAPDQYSLYSRSDLNMSQALEADPEKELLIKKMQATLQYFNNGILEGNL